MAESRETKVFIIEDDFYISEMYRIKFESEHFKITIFNSGIEGIKVMKSEIPDIILLDIVMPKMDGFDVLKIIRSEQKLKNVPVVMLTNLSQKENIERCFELGANGYIVKSHFTPSEVVKKVRSYLKIGN